MTPAYVPQIIQRLARDGVLGPHQVNRLLAKWPDLGDWAADPYFGSLCEHTRAFIETAARKAGQKRRVGA